MTVRVHDADGRCTAPNNVPSVVCTSCMGDPAVRARITPEPPLATVVITTEETSAASGVRTTVLGNGGGRVEHDAQSGRQVVQQMTAAAMVAPADIEDADVFASYQRMMQQVGRDANDEAELMDGASPHASMLFGHELLDGLQGEWVVDGQAGAKGTTDGMLVEPWIGACEELATHATAIGVGGSNAVHHELDNVCGLL